jgi:nucleoside-diphosphate-sugar epimerase
MFASHNSRQVIVSGATGFIGQHLVPLLIKNRYEVIAIARNLTKARSFEWFDKVQFIRADINQEPLDFSFKNGAGLIHLAWDGLPNYKSPFHFEKNLFSNYNFIKSLVYRGIEHVLVSGTCLEYGMQCGPLASSLNADPQIPYAIAKDSLRKFLKCLSSEKTLNLQWARLFYSYGEGQNPNSLLSQLDQAIISKALIFNMSGGEQLRDYLPIEEVANQLFQLYEHKKPGNYNICSGNPISVRSLVEQRIKDSKSNIKLGIGILPYSDYEPMEFWGIRDLLL